MRTLQKVLLNSYCSRAVMPIFMTGLRLMPWLIHRHKKTSESICMVRGKMVMRLYDDKGNVAYEFVMEPCGGYSMVQVEAGQWHSLEVLEEVTVVFEAKDGAWEPLADEDIMRYRGDKVTAGFTLDT